MNMGHLAEILADCLQEIVPSGIIVRADDGMLRYETDSSGPFAARTGGSGTYIQNNTGLPVPDFNGTSDEEKIIGIAMLALDQLQDYVSETTADPWPGTARMPSPHGRIQDSVLYLWYGDQMNPVLACPPISVTELTE